MRKWVPRLDIGGAYPIFYTAYVKIIPVNLHRKTPTFVIRPLEMMMINERLRIPKIKWNSLQGVSNPSRPQPNIHCM